MISIALATYNGEKFIDAQIKSILEQSYQDFEIIICDDCSTDQTVDIIKTIKDNRIKLFQNERNIGFKKNFEKIINKCKGEYIAFCDQDDVWLPNHLLDLITNIKDNVFIGGNAIIVNQNLEDMNITMLNSLGVDFLPAKDNWFKFLLFTNVFQGTASLAKSEFLQSLLPFPDTIKFHDHWIAINAAILNKVTYINLPLLKYRQHLNNVTYNNSFTLHNRIKLYFKEKKSKNTNMLQFIETINKLELTEYQKAILIYAKQFWKKSNLINRISTLIWFTKNYNIIKGSNNIKIKIIRISKYLVGL